MPSNVSSYLLLQTFSKIPMSVLVLARSASVSTKTAAVVVAGAQSQRRLQFDYSELDELVGEGDIERLRRAAELIPAHSAGAFIHGLEDEFEEVRTASVGRRHSSIDSDSGSGALTTTFLARVDMRHWILQCSVCLEGARLPRRHVQRRLGQRAMCGDPGRAAPLGGSQSLSYRACGAARIHCMSSCAEVERVSDR